MEKCRKKIVAVVVTFNRLKYLKAVLSSLKSQTVSIDEVIVVNNGSTDGTTEWLSSCDDLCVINQDNVGGSGGFYTGIKAAYNKDYDWIWCMDDDVYPYENCLEKLLSHDTDDTGILVPSEVQNGRPYITEKRSLNLTNPFKKPELLKPEDLECSSVEIEGMTFEGPLIKRELVEKIGFPNKDFFLNYDDTDYSYRAILGGYKVLYIPSAKIKKEYFAPLSKVDAVVRGKWKLWYYFRNGSYFYHRYGKNFLVRYFGMWRSLLFMQASIFFNLFRNKKYTIKDSFKLWEMYFRGIRGRLGKM